MEIGTQQQVVAAIGGTMGGFMGLGAITGFTGDDLHKPGNVRAAGAMVVGGLASSVVAAAIVPDTKEEPANGVKLATFGASMASGGAVAAGSAGAMGVRGGLLGVAAFGGALAGVMSAAWAITAGPYPK